MLPAVTMECRAAFDPELRFAPSGMAVAKIRTVSSSRKRQDDGTWVDDKTCWLTVTCFRQVAENVAESVAKGDLLLVTGKLVTDEWEDRETHEKRSQVGVLADEVAVSLRFRQVPHGAGKAERSSGNAGGAASDDPWGGGGDAWATSGTGSTEEPPF